LEGFLPALQVLSNCPLGAWYCLGNHDYYGRDAEKVCEKLRSIGITTLRNETVVLTHGAGKLLLGGVDDWLMGSPDFNRLSHNQGWPHLVLSHNPDSFYESVTRNIPLTLSGHTHGGQIRFRGSGPIIRHSRFCLDEGAYCYDRSTLVVSRGLGAVGL